MLFQGAMTGQAEAQEAWNDVPPRQQCGHGRTISTGRRRELRRLEHDTRFFMWKGHGGMGGR